MSGKYALIIANAEYMDPGLAQLTAPGRDAREFGQVLDSPEICAFDDVVVLFDENASKVSETIDYFVSNRKPDDLLVLYFSGHGIRDEYGSLYLAVKNTNRARLRSTAIKSDFIREAMDQSRSKRQVLVLDCCNSGAFTQGTKAATGVSIGTASAFEAGYGRIILTASDSTQFAWEGDNVIGETDNSLFTHFLIEGLAGEADLDGDGNITVDELYDYAYEKVKLATPKQTPSKFSTKQQGEIILRENMRMEDIKPVTLPAPLLDSIENPLADIRLGAVQQLTKLLNSKNLGLARSAGEALKRIAEEDDSRQVTRAAMQALESIRQAEELAKQKEEDERKRLEEEEARRVERQKTEVQRILNERAVEAERQEQENAKQFAEQKNVSERLASDRAREEHSTLESANTTLSQSWNPISWFTLGWAIAGGLGGFIYNSFGEIVGGAVGGIIGGLVMIASLGIVNATPHQKNKVGIVLAWALGGAIGWLIGWELTEAIGAGIGMAIFVTIGMASTFGMDYIRSHWKSIAVITLAWFIGGAIGWSISKGMIDDLSIGYATSWTIGIAIGWATGGFVMSQQIKEWNNKK